MYALITSFSLTQNYGVIIVKLSVLETKIIGAGKDSNHVLRSTW